MLQNAVANFANDLNLISETIKSRTVQQVFLFVNILFYFPKTSASCLIFSNYSHDLKTEHVLI